MSQQESLRWYQDPAYTLMELPYGGGNSFDMYVVMPANQQVSLGSFATSFSSSTWANGLAHLDTQTVNIYLPKWQASYTIPNANPELVALGMGIAFSPGADFSAMFSTPEQISQVIHKAYIDVTETGTQAAAATAVVTTTVDRTGPEIPTVVFDHPYLYFITEKQTGDILFIGTMNNPSSQN